jgi:hypothetical protein
VSQTSPVGSSWQGSLRDLANIVQQIRRMRAFGRLSLRNTERLSIVQIYFRAGKLFHIAGNRGDALAILNEMQSWDHAFLRFDRGVTIAEVTVGSEHERRLDDVLVHLHGRGLVMLPHLPRVIDSNIVEVHDAGPLIAPWEWQVLVEGTRRVSLAVAHLVGPGEALAVLRDILDDCSSAFPAFASLQIAPSGYLQIVDRTHLAHMSRESLLEGFTALIATCQYFCSPIIGDKEAHRLVIQALQDVGPTLVGMGVFQINTRLLSSRN